MRLVKWGSFLVAVTFSVTTSTLGEEVVNGKDLLGDTRFTLVGLAGKCLDVEGGVTTAGTSVNLFRCHGGDNQLWRLDLNGIAQRIVGIGDRCLIPDFNHPSGDIRVVIGACGGVNDLWRLAAPGVERPSRLIHAVTGLCLDVEGAVAADGTPTQLFGCHGDANQIWRPTPEVCTPGASGQCLNRYALVGLAGKCLDVEGASTADGTPANLFRCHGGDNQRWRLGVTAAPQRVVGLGGKCLIPDFDHPSGDIRVAIGDCGDGNDLWRLETPGYSRSSRLIHTSTGMCLDVEAAATADGTPTQLFECHDDANQVWRPAPEVCTQDAQGLCLNQDRFRVDLTWRSFDGTTGSGNVVPVGSDDSGLLWFFEADNWEMLIKVLDGCAHNDRLWVFAAATTTVEYTLTVTDTEVGAIREYFNPLGNAAAAITDTGAFATCPAGLASPSATEDVPAIEMPLATDREPVPLKGSCIPSLTRMCLSGGRFAVEATWRAHDDTTGPARVVADGSTDSGLLWFFSSANWEMLVKVLDACHLDDPRFLMLAAATTDVEYTLTVTDTATGDSRQYFNPLGNAADALVDSFQTCP